MQGGARRAFTINRSTIRLSPYSKPSRATNTTRSATHRMHPSCRNMVWTTFRQYPALDPTNPEALRSPIRLMHKLSLGSFNGELFFVVCWQVFLCASVVNRSVDPCLPCASRESRNPQTKTGRPPGRALVPKSKNKNPITPRVKVILCLEAVELQFSLRFGVSKP